MRAAVVEFCMMVGTDPLLVQGAGGNVSWKDCDTLWIKASGRWLAVAAIEDIFVPVDLHQLKGALASGDFGVTPEVYGMSSLRPSIETLLHVLMPHPVVVHLHAVEILAHLIRDGFEETFVSLLDDSIRWVSVPYHKPGAALAKAVNLALDQTPGANVVFLQNHGVVIGGSDVAEVDRVLHKLTSALATRLRSAIHIRAPSSPLVVSDAIRYLPVSDVDIHRLAIDQALFDRLSVDWALCPDHVVFLGPKPECYSGTGALMNEVVHNDDWPELVFVRNAGVYSKSEFNNTKLAQLRCYHDVLVRQPEKGTINVLSDEQIAELLNWDAEQYRLHVDK